MVLTAIFYYDYNIMKGWDGSKHLLLNFCFRAPMGGMFFIHGLQQNAVEEVVELQIFAIRLRFCF